MNCLDYTVPTFQIDSHQLENILQCIIHTILFHRMIYKSIKPKECHCSAFESISYCSINDPILEKNVQTHIQSLMKKINIQYKNTEQKFYFSISFYKLIEHMWPFQDEHIYTERWNLSISIYSIYDKSLSRDTKDRRVNESYHQLLSILSKANIPTPHLDSNQYLYFDIIHSEQKNLLNDLVDMIKSGPPRIL
jgi:Autophagy-related protein 101